MGAAELVLLVPGPWCTGKGCGPELEPWYLKHQDDMEIGIFSFEHGMKLSRREPRAECALQ